MKRKKILVLRFSAMGDVALMVPVIQSLVAEHHDTEVTLVTRPKYSPFFLHIVGVTIFPADVDKTYGGIFGLFRLFNTLRRLGRYDVVVDLHDHIRTIILRNLFRITGSRVVVFQKGRNEKQAFTRRNNKITTLLPHTVERYRLAFVKAGFSFSVLPPPYFALHPREVMHEKFGEKDSKWIGLAPFALHKTKIWPLNNYAKVMEGILNQAKVRFFLFGGGANEIAFFMALEKQFPGHCEIVAGKISLKEELVLIQHLDLMLCVDSSNMHLAALAGVPLLSIWGGTHPDVGFGPYGKTGNSIIQISREELYCRPCSVYGKETCHRGDFACLRNIGADYVIERMLRVISQ